MAYEYHKLIDVLCWKFPGLQGITTSSGCLVEWPVSVRPWPTDQELAGYVAEYEAYLASNQCKDDELQRSLDRGDWKAVKTLATVLIQKGVCTLAELRAIYRGL